MKILDNEGEVIINLTDVKDEAQLQSLFSKEDQTLTEIMFDTPFFGMSLEEYKQNYDTSDDDFEDMEERVCTYEEWMQDCREWAQGCICD
jgi:hypothetical protein